jgi:hypothetical protein
MTIKFDEEMDRVRAEVYTTIKSRRRADIIKDERLD